MKRSKNPLNDYAVMVVDADQHLSLVLKLMLGEMGFTDVTMTRSGRDALSMLQDTSYDFVITEWNTRHVDGITMLDRIRRDSSSRNPTLPVIMLTGRAEQSDVVVARDHGVNEYVVKPFSAQAIYNRLEHIIEKPRPFVVSKGFVGPDRRHKGKPPEGTAERRTRPIAPKLPPINIAEAIATEQTPKLWLPDTSLKRMLGGGSLATLISPAVLEQAQKMIESVTDESLKWVKEDLAKLMAQFAELNAPNPPFTLNFDMAETALLIKTRAGTFGYTRGSEIAYMLYLFCKNHLVLGNATHHVIVQKHIEVLQVILSHNLRGVAGTAGEQITQELRKLTDKFTS